MASNNRIFVLTENIQSDCSVLSDTLEFTNAAVGQSAANIMLIVPDIEATVSCYQRFYIEKAILFDLLKTGFHYNVGFYTRLNLYCGLTAFPRILQCGCL